jgi:hypothetical protein
MDLLKWTKLVVICNVFYQVQPPIHCSHKRNSELGVVFDTKFVAFTIGLCLCGSRGKRLVINSSYHTCILFIFNPLLYNMTYSSWLATSYNCLSSRCKCGHTIDDVNTHCFGALVGVSVHDTFRDIVVTIVLESASHDQREVFQLFPFHTWWWVDIIIIRNDFQTLMDIIIVDPTHTHMIQRILTMMTNATMMVV